VGRSRILQNKILRRNTGADTTIRLDAITPGEKILMVHNPKNPAYRRICDAVISHGKLYYVLKSSPEIEREDFNETRAVYLTHWGMIECVPTDYRGKIIVGVWEGDSWLRDGQLSEGAATAFGRAHAVFAANQRFADRLRLLTGKSVHVTTDGVDTMLFKPMVHLRPRGKKLRVGIVGCNWRGDDHKGIEIARDACAAVGATLDVLDAKHGTHSYIAHEEMPLWYNRLDALLVCSQEEGGPNPGLEAMACGLPVLSSRVGLMPELLGEEWLCDRTADAFAEKLLALSEMNAGEKKKAGRNNRDRIVSGGWSWEKRAVGFEGGIQSAMEYRPSLDPAPRGKRQVVICGTSLGIGGAERITVDMANTLSRSGEFCVNVVLTVAPGGVFRDLLDPCIPVLFTEDKKDFIHALVAGRPDAVVLNNCWMGVHCIEEITDVHQPRYFGIVLHGSTKWSLDHLKVEMLSRITDVMVISEVIREAIEDHKPEWSDRVSVIENYVDTDRFKPMETDPEKLKQLGWPEDSIVYGYMGRMSSEKRLPVMVDIFNMVLQKEPRARLLMIGGSDPGVPLYKNHWDREAHRVIRAAKNLSIEDKVHITGLVPDPWNYLPTIDLFLLTSRSEGSPLALMEALSCEVPGVCTAVGTIPDTFSCGAGKTLALRGVEFEEDERRAFAEIMVDLTRSNDLKEMGKKGRDLVVERFSLTSYRERVLAHFQERMKSRERKKAAPEWSVIGASSWDLTSEVTVFVSTVGSIEFDACMDALRAQDCRFRLGIVRNVAPMSAAFQMMMDSCSTPYYVQVDEDMHLYPSAISTLYEDIQKSNPLVLLNCRPLMEPFREIAVDGVKIYRHELARKYPISDDAFACEMDHIKRFQADGYEFAVYPKSESYAVGDLNKSWSPDFFSDGESMREALYDIFEKFRRDAQKFHFSGTGVGWVRSWAPRLLERSKRSSSPFDLFALLGIVSGSANKPMESKEKDFRDQTAREEFDKLADLFC
jgi:glycosyltransferase involved in cell wall biosynthesis